MLLRTAKSCGLGAPDAGFKSAGFFLSATVAKEPGNRGEHEGKP
jgi:hypothetical protein